jgi:hypothetical protein
MVWIKGKVGLYGRSQRELAQMVVGQETNNGDDGELATTKVVKGDVNRK